MDSIVTWIGAGFAGLLFVAIVVAWWEHLGRDEQLAEAENAPAPTLHIVSVDVELDDLGSGDARERQQALGGALTRMAAPAAGRPQRWVDTQPTVLKGVAESGATPSTV